MELLATACENGTLSVGEPQTGRPVGEDQMACAICAPKLIHMALEQLKARIPVRSVLAPELQRPED